jgi:hypothetical protein
MSSDAVHSTDDNVNVAPRRATVAAMLSERDHEIAKELEPNEPQSWVKAIHEETPHLFTIGYNEVKVNPWTSFQTLFRHYIWVMYFLIIQSRFCFIFGK